MISNFDFRKATFTYGFTHYVIPDTTSTHILYEIGYDGGIKIFSLSNVY